jgi:hypothetical protein
VSLDNVCAVAAAWNCSASSSTADLRFTFMFALRTPIRMQSEDRTLTSPDGTLSLSGASARAAARDQQVDRKAAILCS